MRGPAERRQNFTIDDIADGIACSQLGVRLKFCVRWVFFSPVRVLNILVLPGWSCGG